MALLSQFHNSASGTSSTVRLSLLHGKAARIAAAVPLEAFHRGCWAVEVAWFGFGYGSAGEFDAPRGFGIEMKVPLRIGDDDARPSE